MIWTYFVESTNWASGKDNKGLTHKTNGYWKIIEPHDADMIFLKAVYNLTKENEKFRFLIKPNTKHFETKYIKSLTCDEKRDY